MQATLQYPKSIQAKCRMVIAHLTSDSRTWKQLSLLAKEEEQSDLRMIKRLKGVV